MNGRDEPPLAEDLPEFFVVKDELDLHGFFPEQVPEVVDEFLRHACASGFARVRIVHGKGRSKLKWAVHRLLRSHPLVEAFGDAPPEAGGWGATIALLRCDKSQAGTAP
ncbi:MAG: Smr/MutS family protein [Calditrichaeota bacterium]|nr:Smr/MutS family protein [Calditrichota bacterium]